MRSKMRKPIAVLLSALMLLTMVSIGFVAPAFAADTTALDAAIADANALTPTDYVDFSGVTAAVNAAADTTGKTQIEIDDMEDAIHVALAKLELQSKFAPQNISSYVQYNATNMVYIYGQVMVSGAYAGQSPAGAFRCVNQSGAWFVMSQNVNDVYANIYLDRYAYSNLSQLGEFISLTYSTAGYRHLYDVYIDHLRTNLAEETGWTYATQGATLTSANGESLYYELNKNAGLLTGDQYTAYVTGSTELSRSYTVGINGALPSDGDSVQFRVVANPLCTTLQDDLWYIGGAYVILNLFAYDTTNLRSAMAFNAAAKSSYTSDSYAAYRSALDAASPILNKGNPTQDEIDSAATALNNAINGLKTTVTINAGGGIASAETMEITVGANSSVTIPNEAEDLVSRAGYDFVGWDKDTVTFNDTVTAQWTARSDTAYTVNHYYMDATGSYNVDPVTESKTGTTDTDAVFADLLSVPEHFAYDAEATGATSANINGDGDTVIDLYYSRDQYTVTFVSGATGATLDTQTVYYEADANAPEAPAYVQKDADGHYKFTGWDEDFTNISGDLTVTALYDTEAHDAFGAYTNDGDTHSRTCANCNYEETGEHNFVYTPNNDGTHNVTCRNCDYEALNVACTGGEATCVDKALCDDCGAVYGDVDATNHAGVREHEAVAATCTAPGHTAGDYCYACETWITGETVNQLSHSYTNYTHIVDGDDDPTNDQHTANCDNNCGETDTKNCTFGEGVVTQPTCTEQGYTTYTCTMCGFCYKADYVNANDHSYVYTSNGDGTHTVTCRNCDFRDAADCDYDETFHEATCAKGSYTAYACKDCDYSYDGPEANDKLDHSYVYTPNGDGTHNVTCNNCDYEALNVACTGGTATCVEKAKCDVCHGEYGDYGDHAYGDWTRISDTQHQRVCNNNLAHVETKAHNWDNGVETGNATCLEPGHKLFTCNDCGATKEEDTAYGAHDMTQHVEYKAPTCIADGNPEYWFCGTCEKYYLTADGSDEGQSAAPVLHDANAHKFGEMVREVSATCTAAGVKAHKTCEYCGDNFDADGVKFDTLVIGKLDHDFGEWIEEVPAGCTVPGTKGHYTCSMCGDDFDADENKIDDLSIPAAGHTFPLVHVEAKEAGCPNHAAMHAPRRSGSPVTVTGNNGNIEYWYCEACGAYFADEAGTTALTAADIIIPAAHRMTHVAYKAPTTEAEGNKEYWICELCGDYFADEAGTQKIADKTSVILAKLTQETPTEPTDPTEPTTDNGGSSTTDFRISIWEWLARIIRKLLSMFKFGGGEGSIC